MNKIYKGNELVRWLVMASDFIILNLILLTVVCWDIISIPSYFGYATKITFFVANTSLFISETFFSSIIHLRKVSWIQVFGRTQRLATATILIFYLVMDLLVRGGQ